MLNNIQEGASETDLSVLPKYRFQVSNDENKPDIHVGAGRMVPVESNVGYLAVERVLLPEDAVSLINNLIIPNRYNVAILILIYERNVLCFLLFRSVAYV